LQRDIPAQCEKPGGGFMAKIKRTSGPDAGKVIDSALVMNRACTENRAYDFGQDQSFCAGFARMVEDHHRG